MAKSEFSDLYFLDRSIKAVVSKGTKMQVASNWNSSGEHFKKGTYLARCAEVEFLCGEGLAARMQGDFNEANRTFNEALSLSRRIHSVDGELESLSGLIDCLRRNKSINLARTYKEQSMEILSGLPADPPRLSVVNAYTNYGLLEHDMNDNTTALESYFKAERECRRLLKEKPRNKYYKNRLARVFTVRPEAYKGLEMYEEAYTDQKIALDLNTKLGEVRGLGNSTYSLGEIAEKINKIDDARNWYMESLKASEKMVDGKIIVIDPVINEMADKALGRLASV